MAFLDYLIVPTMVDLASTEKPAALKELAQVLCKALKLKKSKPVIDAIQKREEASSTYIGQGVALPHAKVQMDQEIGIVVGRSIAGVSFDAARGALAQFIVLLVEREGIDPNKHIQILAEIAAVLKADDVRNHLLHMSPAQEIRAVLAPSRKKRQQERKPNSSILSAAARFAQEIKAKAIIIFADTVRNNDFLEQIHGRKKVIIVTSTKSRFDSEDRHIKAIIQAPPFPASRTGQVKIGILLAMSRNLIDKDDKVVCISGNAKTGLFDTIITLDVAAEYEFFFTSTRNLLPEDVKPEVLERVLGLASEISIEGREGKPIGTIFVVGDTNSVNQYISQLIINPFRGYSETERNLLDPGLDETIKEFAAIDGAFIITGEGTILSAGSYLRPQSVEIKDLPGGFGARHAAAAGITACTNAIAITISESNGLVTLFKNGAIMMTLSKPVIQEKTMVQKMP